MFRHRYGSSVKNGANCGYLRQNAELRKMDFKLNFSVPPLPVKLNYSDKVMLLGSCFAENIGDQLLRSKFNVCVNPHGIIYNPLNSVSCIEEYIGKKKYTENELFYANDCWNSFSHHSRFSVTDKEACLDAINSAIGEAHVFLKEAKWLMITFGSAFIYKDGSGNHVANCHKLPQKEFTKELVPAEQIIGQFKAVLEKLKEFNPSLQVLFTVSPVRYVRDGLVENNLSKAVLLQSVHELVRKQSHCFYFPAYEIVNDELRDYRFFKEDLVHPNEMAVNYVWEKFMDAAFDKPSKELYLKISEILTATEHKPFNPDSELHKAFRKSYASKVAKLKNSFPFLDLEQEHRFFGKE